VAPALCWGVYQSLYKRYDGLTPTRRSVAYSVVAGGHISAELWAISSPARTIVRRVSINRYPDRRFASASSGTPHRPKERSILCFALLLWRRAAACGAHHRPFAQGISFLTGSDRSWSALPWETMTGSILCAAGDLRRLLGRHVARHRITWGLLALLDVSSRRTHAGW